MGLRTATLLVAVLMVLAACGSDPAAPPSSTTGDSTGATATATTIPSTGPSSSSSDAATTTNPATTSPPPLPTSTSLAGPNDPLGEEALPGEDFDLFPAAGSVLAVVGVPFDDVLNVRLGPGIDFDVIATLDPLSNEFVASGRARLLPNSIWFEGTTVDGLIGWLSSRFTAAMGSTDDITSFVVQDLGEIPTAEDMEALGLLVAESQASTDPLSDIVLVVEPTVGDLGEVTYDVIGLGDDAVHGIRLHVFGAPTNGGFSLKSVESTALCVTIRGTAENGACN